MMKVLNIFALMDVLLWDNSNGGYKKEKSKYEPHEKKQTKHGESSGMNKGRSSINEEEDEEDEKMAREGRRHRENKNKY